MTLKGYVNAEGNIVEMEYDDTPVEEGDDYTKTFNTSSEEEGYGSFLDCSSPFCFLLIEF